MMSGHRLAQVNTAGSWSMNNPSPGKDTGIHPRDLGAEPRDEHQSCCCPRTPCSEEFDPRKQGEEFFHSSIIHRCQLIFPLVTQEQN